jgi:hypothetical protein
MTSPDEADISVAVAGLGIVGSIMLIFVFPAEGSYQRYQQNGLQGRPQTVA